MSRPWSAVRKDARHMRVWQLIHMLPMRWSRLFCAICRESWAVLHEG